MKDKLTFSNFLLEVKQNLDGEIYEVPEFFECENEDDFDCECGYCVGTYGVVKAYETEKELVFELLNSEATRKHFEKKIDELENFFKDFFSKHETLYFVEREEYENEIRVDRHVVDYFHDYEDCELYCDHYYER